MILRIDRLRRHKGTPVRTTAELSDEEVKTVSMAHRLSVVAQVLEWVALIASLLGLIAGISLALHTNTEANGIRLFAEHTSLQIRRNARWMFRHYNVRTARGKECPDCIEDAWEEASVCPFCNYRFDDADA